MSTLTKPKKAARKVVKPSAQVEPRKLKPGQPTAGFLAGTVKIGPRFDPAAPAFGPSEWTT